MCGSDRLDDDEKPKTRPSLVWGGLGRAENDRPASPVMRCPTVWFSPSQLCPSHFVWFPVYSMGRPDGGLLPKLHLARFLRILGTNCAMDITFYVVREKK